MEHQKSQRGLVLRLEAGQRGNYVYPDINVDLNRLNLTTAVRKTANKFNINKVERTAEENDGTPYIGNIQYDQAMNLVKSLPDGLPLNLRLFVDFLKAVQAGARNDKRVYLFDSTGRGIRKTAVPVILNRVMDEIVCERAPYRGECINQSSTEMGNDIYFTYSIPRLDGKVVEVKEPLDDCLMEDRRIDLRDWLRSATPQGLPMKKVKEGSLFYYPPSVGTVAWFGAGSDGVGLDCGGNPRVSNSAFGVRRAKIMEK